MRGDGTHLFVADLSNNRVLVWNQVPTAPTDADFALGQLPGATNLTTSDHNVTAGSLYGANGVASDGNTVLVADLANRRILRWDTFPTPTHLDADAAIGASDDGNNLTSQGAFVAHDAVHFAPYGVAMTDHQLFVADFAANRVLVWNSLPTSPQQPADFALGQPADSTNLTSTSANANATTISASGLAGVFGVATDGRHLFVTDFGNARVLIWNQLPTAPVPADVVLGQSAMDQNVVASNPNASSMGNPYTVSTDGNMLFVCDALFNRILVWRSIPTQNAQPADFALGQPAGPNNLVTAYVNDANTGDPTASTLSRPVSATVVAGHLFVSDYFNTRELVWNTLPTQGGQPADFALGQNDLTSNTPSPAQGASVIGPSFGAATDGNCLYISDFLSHRVLVWNTFPTKSGAPANALYGEPDMNSTTSPPAIPTGSVLSSPLGIASDGTRLFVCDPGYSRLNVLPTAP